MNMSVAFICLILFIKIKSFAILCPSLPTTHLQSSAPSPPPATNPRSRTISPDDQAIVLS